MKYGHLHTFKNNINFVKPLYRKVKFRKCKPKNINYLTNLDGDDDADSIRVKKVCEINKETRVNKCVIESRRAYAPRINNFVGNGKVTDNKYGRNVNEGINELGDTMLYVNKNDVTTNSEERNSKKTQTDKKIHKAENWLRIYPASRRDLTSVNSMIFRCVMCQLGLAAFLVLWTMLWVFVINSFEEPYERMVSEEFGKEQNQLVIDLATELRQITPISPRWRQAIERRIEDERQLTVAAVGRGARLHPGQFWDLPGTFLFTVYVMTALGFGAPVPQTIWGRTSALIYAFFVIPTHIYLILNASTCLVVNIEMCMKRRKSSTLSIEHKHGPVGSKNPEQNVKSSNNIRKRFLYTFSILTAGRCVPLVTALYYACGALTFGLARHKSSLEIIMFPLEFTTTGGLDQAEGYVRILYAFYVEGATCLLACAVATMRRHSSDAVNSIANKYSLFIEEDD